MTDDKVSTGRSYYYEVVAYDSNGNFSPVADGLTVKVGEQPPPRTTPEHIQDNYELVFSDEFNTGSLDLSKWNTAYLWGPNLVINQEEQYYVDVANDPGFGYNPFVLDGETLTIRSIPTPDHLLSKANGQPYLSGVITSYDAFKMTYGYVEARLKMPYGRGLWSAFWLLNAYYVDAKPEIDIVEHIGHDLDALFHTYHYYDADGTLHSTESQPSTGVDFTSEYRTYAVEWQPGSLIYYIDGVERHRISDPKVSSQEMYIIANQALGGWWPGSPDATTQFPGDFKIDYIRAYTRIGSHDLSQHQNDGDGSIPPRDEVNYPTSPNHIPPPELWPEGYPELQ